MQPKKLLTSNSGSVLLLVALMFLFLMLVVAIVVDLGRLYAVHTKAQAASDAALLGAVATADTTDVNTEYNALFNASFPANYLGSDITTIAVTKNNSGAYQANFDVTVPTVVMQLFGNTSSTVHILSEVVGGFQNVPTKLELALVMDNSGSMGNTISGGSTTKIDALKTASKSLVDIIYGNSESLDGVHVSVVPYDLIVQIGLGHSDWMQDIPKFSPHTGDKYKTSKDKYLHYQNYVDPDGFKGFAFNKANDDDQCGPYDYLHHEPFHAAYDDTCPPPGTMQCNQTCHPETGLCDAQVCSPVICTPTHHDANPAHDDWFQTTWCQDNGANDNDDSAPVDDKTRFREPMENKYDVSYSYINNSDGDNFKYTRQLAPIAFGMNTKTDIKAALDAMTISGSTRINVGLMWGWFTLSPKWTGLWDASKPNLPSPPTVGLSKAIVLMTDGVNIFGPNHQTNDEVGYPLNFPGDDAKTASLCTAIKNTGVTIYTIGFGSTGEYNKDLLQNCASLPTYFFEAPTTDELQNVFHAIGDSILYNTIRLTH